MNRCEFHIWIACSARYFESSSKSVGIPKLLAVSRGRSIECSVYNVSSKDDVGGIEWCLCAKFACVGGSVAFSLLDRESNAISSCVLVCSPSSLEFHAFCSTLSKSSIFGGSIVGTVSAWVRSFVAIISSNPVSNQVGTLESNKDI